MKTLRNLFLAQWSPGGFVVWAVLILISFGLLHLLGWREATTILTGTIPPKASAAATMLKALLYMGSYFGAVVLAPILIIGAGLQWFWGQFVDGRQLPQ
jgi:hypothetical protein